MKIKRAIILCLTIMLMIGVGGCDMDVGLSQTEKKQKAILEEMGQHLLERYGEFEYEPYGVQPSGWDHSYDLCNMYIQRGETEEERDKFAVKRYYDKETDSYYFTDNYYWHIIRDEYEAYMKRELSDLFPECRVYLGANADSEVFPDVVTDDTTFEQALEMGLPKHHIWVIVDPESMVQEEFTALEGSLKEKWSEKHPSPILMVSLPESTEIYNVISRYNLQDYIENYIAEIDNRGLGGH